MGYTRKKTIKLTFGEGHEFEGLEVRMKTVGIGKLLKLLPMIDRLDSIGDLSQVSTPEQVAEIEKSFQEIAKIIDSWNVEDEHEDGTKTPVPCTYEELITVDVRLVVCVMQGWATHLAGVPAPLDEPSSSGEPSLEASLPMEPLSPSLQS